MFTTITLAVSDGTNVTAKDIVVKVTNGGTNATAGVSSPILTVADYSAANFVHEPQIGAAATASAITAGSVAITATQQAGSNIGFGFTRSQEGLFFVEPGKVYRVRSDIDANPSTLTEMYEMRLRLLMRGATFGVNTTMESNGGDYGLSPAGTAVTTFESLYQPPTNARLVAAQEIVSTNISTISFDVIVLGTGVATRSGGITFSNTSVDAFDAPALQGEFSNGALAVYDTEADWSTGAGALQTDLNDGLTTTDAGWKYQIRDLNFNFTGTGGTLDLGTLLPAAGTIAGVADNGTSVSWGSDAVTSDTVEMWASTGGTHIPQWEIGGFTASGGNDGSVIPVSLIAENADCVYYRVSAIMRNTNASGTGSNAFSISCGHPNSAWTGQMETGSANGGSPGPVSGEDTVYSCWVKGAPQLPNSGGADAINNFAVRFFVIDSQGSAGENRGGATIIDTVVVQQFPVDWF